MHLRSGLLAFLLLAPLLHAEDAPAEKPSSPESQPSVDKPAEDPKEPGFQPPPVPKGKEGDGTSYPVAKRVAGQPSIVVSSYTGKQVDVEGIPSGKLVMDPTAGPSTGKKKFCFRVP